MSDRIGDTPVRWRRAGNRSL